MATIYPPYIIERSSRGERTYDIFSRLLMDRIVFLGAPINDDVSNIIIAQLQKSNRLQELERALTEEKAFAFLLSQSTVDEATS